jgi:hypothetical protein
MALQRSEIAQTYLSANEQANEFARTGLANLVLLNGGAILAFAPIGSMFHVEMKTIILFAIASLASFVIGLVAAVVAYLAGFFVNSKLSEMMQYAIVDPTDKKIEIVRISHNKTRSVGIVLALVSAALFIVGSILGALAIYIGS